VFILQDNHPPSIGFDVSDKINLKGEIPSIVGGQFVVPWSCDYSWFLLPWAHFSLREAKSLCGYLQGMGLQELYACKKESCESGNLDFVPVPTNNYERFLVVISDMSPDEFVLLNADCSIVFYCNYAADILAIRFATEKDVMGVLSNLLLKKDEVTVSVDGVEVKHD
jgi:hypothetical protein